MPNFAYFFNQISNQLKSLHGTCSQNCERISGNVSYKKTKTQYCLKYILDCTVIKISEYHINLYVYQVILQTSSYITK